MNWKQKKYFILEGHSHNTTKCRCQQYSDCRQETSQTYLTKTSDVIETITGIDEVVKSLAQS